MSAESNKPLLYQSVGHRPGEGLFPEELTHPVVILLAIATCRTHGEVVPTAASRKRPRTSGDVTLRMSPCALEKEVLARH